MKNRIKGALMVLAFISISSLGFISIASADHINLDDPRYVLGKVVDIDKSKGEVTILDERRNYDRQVIVKGDDIDKIEVGDRVKVTLGTRTNVARSVILEDKNPS